MNDDPDKWRLAIAGSLPHKPLDERRAAKKTLQNHAKSYNFTGKVKQNLKVKSKIQLRRRHFGKHFKKWEDGDTSDAKEEFERIHQEQEGKHDFTDGDSGIEIDDPERRTLDIVGTESRSGVGHPHPIPITDLNMWVLYVLFFVLVISFETRVFELSFSNRSFGCKDVRFERWCL